MSSDCMFEEEVAAAGANTTNTMTVEQYWYCEVHYQLQQLKTFAPPVLIIIGSIGNVLAFAILSRKNVRQWSVCFYLSVLAIANTLVLYLGCGLDWVSFITGRPYIVELADWVCRVWHFVFSVIRYFTNWLIVAMVVDRFITMWMPHKAQHLCTVFIAKFVTIILVIGLIVISVHALWTYELTVDGCYILQTRDFQTIAWPWISAVLYSYVPSVLVFIFIILLLIGIIHPHMYQDNPTQAKLTNVVLVLAVFFLAFTLPMLIMNIMQYSKPLWMNSEVNMVKFWMAMEICQILSCLNHSISFLLYFALIPMMRTELSSLVSRLVRSARHSSSATTELRSIEANGDVKKEDSTMVTLL